MLEKTEPKFKAVIIMTDGKRCELTHLHNTDSIATHQWARDGGFWWNDPSLFVAGQSNLIWIPYHAILRVETSGVPLRSRRDDD